MGKWNFYLKTACFYYSFFITWNCKEKGNEVDVERWRLGSGGICFLTKYNKLWKAFKELTQKLMYQTDLDTNLSIMTAFSEKTE